MRWLSLQKNGDYDDMIVRMLVEYEVLGDDEYAYVAWFEQKVRDTHLSAHLNMVTRQKVLRDLVNRGLIIKNIKELRVEIC